jgi:hypothetical protein
MTGSSITHNEFICFLVQFFCCRGSLIIKKNNKGTEMNWSAEVYLSVLFIHKIVCQVNTKYANNIILWHNMTDSCDWLTNIVHIKCFLFLSKCRQNHIDYSKYFYIQNYRKYIIFITLWLVTIMSMCIILHPL